MRTCVRPMTNTLLTLSLALLLVACSDDDGDPVCNHDGVCDVADGETQLGCPDDCPICNHDGTCDSSFGENETNCPDDCPICNHDGTCDSSFGENETNCPDDCPADPCNHDGVCDSGETPAHCPDDCPADPCNHDGVCDSGEDYANCPDDCASVCDPSTIVGQIHDFVVSEIFIPETSMGAAENGIDLDGDGDVDNKLASILVLMASTGSPIDINQVLNQQIAAGDLLLLGRIQESGQGDGVITLKTLRGGAVTTAPVFDGSDQLPIDPSTPAHLLTCGTWVSPELTTDASRLYLFLPAIFDFTASQEIDWFELHAARVQTVTDPSSVYFSTSAVTTTSWTDVMVGGGLTREQIHNDLLPAVHANITATIAAGGSDADTMVGLFDGNCSQLSDVPGCESVVAGQGECDDTADPPVITLTEIQCNALLHSALAPDVDIDGDSVNDLFSFGYRIVSAVSATLY